MTNQPERATATLELEPGPSIDAKVENQLRKQKKKARAEKAAMRAALKAERQSKDIAKLRTTPILQIKLKHPRRKERKPSIKASLQAIDGHPPVTVADHDFANQILREAIKNDKSNEATPG